MSGSSDDLGVSVVRGPDEEPLREHVSLKVHFSGLYESALLWRNSLVSRLRATD